MTATELQKLRRKQTRDDTKIIESILHPCPTFKGITVCHEHTRNGKIRFTAWKNLNPVANGKQFVVDRIDVLTRPEFYMLYNKDMKWMCVD